MKFHQIVDGQLFEYQGELYRKAGPMLATHQLTEAKKFIPRYAEIQPASDDAVQTIPAVRPIQLESEMVLKAFESFYQQCHQCLQQLSANIDSESMQTADAHLKQARQQFMTMLSVD